jgi:hypothetical protein
MIVKSRANDYKEARITHAERIAQWQSQSVANWWRAAGGPHLGVGERNRERGKLQSMPPFYRGRKDREEKPGPHVGDGESAVTEPVEMRHGACSPISCWSHAWVRSV